MIAAMSSGGTVTLTGRDLDLESLVRVARAGAHVTVGDEALDRMGAARALAERAITEGAAAYGVTTGVGVRKTARVERDGHDRLLLDQHLVGQGEPAPRDVVRATALRVANALAAATTAARPETAVLLVAALNDDRLPAVRTLGSIGQADLAPLADLAAGVVGDRSLERGEAIALLNQNAFATAWGALALADALTLLAAADVACGLSYAALPANRSVLRPSALAARPSPGLTTVAQRLAALLEGCEATAASLQDPLSFRTAPQLHGSARDAFAFVRQQVELELNAAQSNPFVSLDEEAVFSVGAFEAAPLALALDVARLALAPVLSSSCERAVKLLQARVTGLPEGLGARAGLAESALSEVGIAVQAFASEARLLAQPVSLELVSTTQADGIEDRMTMAPLAARRLAEMASLGSRVVACEAFLAAQACDLRGARLGPGVARAYDTVRSVAPFVGEGDRFPDLEPLVAVVRSGLLGAP